MVRLYTFVREKATDVTCSTTQAEASQSIAHLTALMEQILSSHLELSEQVGGIEKRKGAGPEYSRLEAPAGASDKAPSTSQLERVSDPTIDGDTLRLKVDVAY